MTAAPNPPDFTLPALIARNRDPAVPPVRITDLVQHPDGDWSTHQLDAHGDYLGRHFFEPETGVSYGGTWTLHNPVIDTRLPLEAHSASTGETVPLLEVRRYASITIAYGATTEPVPPATEGTPQELFYTTEVMVPGPFGPAPLYFNVTSGKTLSDDWTVRNVMEPYTQQLSVTLGTDGHIHLKVSGLGVSVGGRGAYGSLDSARASIPKAVQDWYALYLAKDEIADAVRQDCDEQQESG